MNPALEKRSSQVRKSIQSHQFTGEGGEEYEASAFNGFGDYFRRKKVKLQNLDASIRATSGDLPQVFKGVVAHVSGYTQPSLQVLHKELVQHGAGFLQYLDGKTMATHIIASSLTPKKMIEFARYRVVKPSWVMDSIKAGKMLPWSNYKITSEGALQKTLSVGGTHGLSSQATPKAQSVYRQQSDNGFYGSQLRPSQASMFSPKVQAHSPSPAQFQSPSPFSNVHSSSRTEEIVDEDVNEPGFSSFEIPDEIIDEGEERAVQMQKSKQSCDESLSKPIESGLPKTLFNLHSTSSVTTQQESIKSVSSLSTSHKQAPGNPPFLPSVSTELPLPNLERSLSAPKPQITLPNNPTSEQYNAWLLSDPHYRKASSANPEFLKQFYSESRLHHLSTWKAELKSRMQRLAAEQTPAPAPVKQRPGMRKYVFHVDFDCFFCAVSLKNQPSLVDKPVAVAHGTGKGSEIASCNYPARKFGVKNGMMMKTAHEACPELKILPYDFPAYEVASEQFYEAVISVGAVVQSVSIDEALIDATQIVHDAAGSDGVGDGEEEERQVADSMALQIRRDIKERTSCNVSVGIGANILLAKVALRKAKPAGQYQIRPDEMLDILGDLETRSLPGVASSISSRLSEAGINLVKDLRNTSKQRLSVLLGPKTGERLWEYAHGIDKTEVGVQPPRKSVSAEVSWGIRFVNQTEAEDFLFNLCKELERRLLNERVRGKNLTVKIMRRSANAPFNTAKHLGHGACDTFNKSVVFGVATNNAETISREAVSVLRSYKFSPGDLRGLGVQLTKLEPLKHDAFPASSQRKLVFPAFKAPSNKRTRHDALVEDGERPGNDSASSKRKARRSASFAPAIFNASLRRTSSNSFDFEDDPIADTPLTPKLNRGSPAGRQHPAFALTQTRERDGMAQTPLNISGTQFVLPANADPAVVAELPTGIRSRLLAQGRPKKERPKEVSTQQHAAGVADLLSSQVDPEVFAALPDDMKEEVLALYGRRAPASASTSAPISGTTSVTSDASLDAGTLSNSKHSPHREERTRPGATTPTKRQNRTKARERIQDARRGLTQTNIFATASRTQSVTVSPSRPHARHMTLAPTTMAAGPAVDDLDGLDPEFLAELPEDVRNEVIEDHRRQRLARHTRAKSGAWTQASRPQQGAQGAAKDRTDSGSAHLQPREPVPVVAFPRAPRKIEFESLGTASEAAIRDMITAWVQGTMEEGPHVDDVDIFGEYIARVVFEEQAMDKAARLVRWVEWKVQALVKDRGGGEDVDSSEGYATRAWVETLTRVKEIMLNAVMARGLPPIKL
ncbi:hypothetical protein BROUX41_000114 [Berkeleyomyces rouxiae]|uniref:uncharacterized protein n=1 Tax=Berkeleyomyces rouxiae TaxID=2035830 RepID=UPI003B765F16